MDQDADGLLSAVRSLVGDASAQILSIKTSGYEDGFADAMTGGDGVNHHSGLAGTQDGDVEFSIVSKTCNEFSQGADPKS
ncbi:hypothetical protein [Aliiruegeria sabulilitoris]|uniref:hypothetical protein n=1 Tax=Aliiruegeria sabulilitoris TaxID=1510458 RepID=UPI00083138F1|nr:hypothetical protein [Aliiruegeria sabulilitoris]NDR58648.1 hypothetical protein [Pseudoruegeria sp. M32A2M]